MERNIIVEGNGQRSESLLNSSLWSVCVPSDGHPRSVIQNLPEYPSPSWSTTRSDLPSSRARFSMYRPEKSSQNLINLMATNVSNLLKTSGTESVNWAILNHADDINEVLYTLGKSYHGNSRRPVKAFVKNKKFRDGKIHSSGECGPNGCSEYKSSSSARVIIAPMSITLTTKSPTQSTSINTIILMFSLNISRRATLRIYPQGNTKNTRNLMTIFIRTRTGRPTGHMTTRVRIWMRSTWNTSLWVTWEL